MDQAPKFIFSLTSFYAYSGVLFYFCIVGRQQQSCCTSENSPQALVGKHVLTVIVGPFELPQS